MGAELEGVGLGLGWGDWNITLDRGEFTDLGALSRDLGLKAQARATGAGLIHLLRSLPKAWIW